MIKVFNYENHYLGWVSFDSYEAAKKHVEHTLHDYWLYDRDNCYTCYMEIYNNATAADGDNMLRIYSPDTNNDIIKINGKNNEVSINGTFSVSGVSTLNNDVVFNSDKVLYCGQINTNNKLINTGSGDIYTTGYVNAGVFNGKLLANTWIKDSNNKERLILGYTNGNNYYRCNTGGSHVFRNETDGDVSGPISCGAITSGNITSGNITCGDVTCGQINCDKITIKPLWDYSFNCLTVENSGGGWENQSDPSTADRNGWMVWSGTGIETNKADWVCPTTGLWAISWWLDVEIGNFAIINKNQRTVVCLDYGTSMVVLQKNDLLRSTGYWKGGGRITIGSGRGYWKLKLVMLFDL